MSLISQGIIELAFAVGFEMKFEPEKWLLIFQVLIAILHYFGNASMYKNAKKTKSDQQPIIEEGDIDFDKQTLIITCFILLGTILINRDTLIFSLAFLVIYSLFTLKFQRYFRMSF